MTHLARVALCVLALPSVALAQPAAAPAHRGFVEGGLAYGYQMSNSQYVEVNQGTLLQSPRRRGPALDLAGGYSLLPNLAIMGDVQWAHASQRQSQNNDGDTAELTLSFASIAIGVRITVPTGRGEVYAQLGLGISLPFETELDENRGGGETRNTTIGYNSGIGARSEMGYHVALNDRMYLAAGLRLQAFATDNVGKQRVRTDQPGGQVERETYSTNPDANNTRDAEALSLQDVSVRIGFGYRL